MGEVFPLSLSDLQRQLRNALTCRKSLQLDWSITVTANTIMPISKALTSLFGPLSTEFPKPPLPYSAKWRFTAKSHTVSSPTPVVRGCCINSESDRAERRKLRSINRCLKHPPLPGKEGYDTVSLEVVDLLKGGDGHNSQVFTVRLLDFESSPELLPRKGTMLVAKVYDPLYFDDDEGHLNPFLCVDRYYTHEANAYMALSELQGEGIPRYYGSYSLSLSVNSVHTRIVRMILVDHIEGITMADAKPVNFAKSVRKSILKSIVDLESRIFEKDIWLTDLEPRNVMIGSPDSDRPGVVIIDFAHALFNRRRDDPPLLQLDQVLGEYISPVLRWKEIRGKGDSFSEWIDWDWDPWLEAEFAHTIPRIKPGMRERWPDD
ncbi:uncharacterized protein N7515_003097 [Penicillium bovifimosum]|uniref:Protein kinase domain-containing protein n=1 Tax=Penicillium bovifimosum TaxID=126998 RepID=A0A9W9H403_9EURO|nr:uncharacterized protein N7515_003097 [Penicillium bovifimosum]KAJ5138249.1 hypothetical protein N7515_003097 [Penicillium bovifimosum]